MYKSRFKDFCLLCERLKSPHTTLSKRTNMIYLGKGYWQNAMTLDPGVITFSVAMVFLELNRPVSVGVFFLFFKLLYTTVHSREPACSLVRELGLDVWTPWFGCTCIKGPNRLRENILTIIWTNWGRVCKAYYIRTEIHLIIVEHYWQL